MHAQQLSLLDENDELSLLKREVDEMRRSYEASRKGLFARHNELARLYLELKEQVEAAGWTGHKYTQS